MVFANQSQLRSAEILSPSRFSARSAIQRQKLNETNSFVHAGRAQNRGNGLRVICRLLGHKFELEWIDKLHGDRGDYVHECGRCGVIVRGPVDGL